MKGTLFYQSNEAKANEKIRKKLRKAEMLKIKKNEECLFIKLKQFINMEFIHFSPENLTVSP